MPFEANGTVLSDDVTLPDTALFLGADSSAASTPSQYPLPAVISAFQRRSAGPVVNPMLKRCWAGIAGMALGLAGSRLNVVYLGDSVMGLFREICDARLKIEWPIGGFAGRLSGETGFYDDGNGTNCTQTTGDYTTSPVGVFWDLASGGSKYFSVGNVSSTNPMGGIDAAVFAAPTNCTRIGVYYCRKSGGGTFKVQISTKAAPSTYVDVTGLTAIDTNGSTALLYSEVAISATDVSRYRIVHVSGGNCAVVGALVGADIGVYCHGWNVGGIPLSSMVASPRFAELAALVPADVILTSYLDSPGDSATSTGMTLTQLINYICDGIRTAFPATLIPPSTTPWAGKSPTPAARRPHLVFLGANRTQTSSVNLDDYDAALKANAIANGDTFVDVNAIWGSWLDVWDAGLMSSGDGNGTSTHPVIMFYAIVAGLFLNATGLINGAIARARPRPLLHTLRVGSAATLGANNSKNRVAISDGVTKVSAGPADRTGYGDLGLMVESSGSNFEAGILLRTLAGSREFLVCAQAAGTFILRDLTGSRSFLTYASNQQLGLGINTGDTVAIGPRSQFLSGIRHGSGTLAAGVQTVVISGLQATARVVVTRTSRAGTPGCQLDVAISSGQFVVTSRDSAGATATSDTSTFCYIVVEP